MLTAALQVLAARAEQGSRLPIIMEATARPARAAAAPAAAAAVLQGVGMEAMAAPAPVRPTAAQGVRHSAGTGKMEQMHLAAVAAATTATVLAPRRSPTHP